MSEPYVTPERFRTMGFGVDLSTIEDFELRSVLRRASDRVNSICAAPALPQDHDFRGGSITGEHHGWSMGNGVDVDMQRTVYLWHTPLKDVSAMSIRLTNNQGVVFDPAELYVTDQAVNIVSLAMTSMGLFGAYVVPEIGLTTPQIVTDYTYGYEIAMTGQTLDATDGLLFRAQDQWWLSTADVNVYVNGSVVLPADYTVDYEEGTVTFDDSPPAEATVKADYTTTLPRAIATATGILAAEALGESEMRGRGMSGLARVRVGEIELERLQQMRGGTTLVTPAQAEADGLLAPYRFAWAGA